MSKYVDFESEIENLESLLGNLEAAKVDALQSEYHQYIASSLELDIEEIQSRLDELYAIQDEQFAREMKELNLQYEEVRL